MVNIANGKETQMAFRGNLNLPNPEDIKRCAFGGSNNSKAKGGCGKYVLKTGRMVRSKQFGSTWHIWHYFDYCKDHIDLDTSEYVNGVLPTLEV